MPLKVTGLLTCRAAGASGDVFGWLKVNYDIDSGSGAESVGGRMEGWMGSDSDLTVDTTGTLVLDLTGQASISHAANGFTIDTGLATWHDPSP